MGIYVTSQVDVLRRSGLSIVTLLLCIYSGVAPTLGTSPHCAVDVNKSDLQSQTTPHTCSPACAVSIIRLHDIAAAENEIAELCLTRESTHCIEASC